ncbi:hypothetical protein DMB42_00815 [Nonomuraea sp. WAC 01424]|uniref:hypothetical protein n=1 Tax=Nonomuraea sp. WAC 01424 TaxID=2203200 RepID=UPI000F77A0AA|nr:hypothetical protein [Nonomuraea sp. WAC 01424]RSN15432.1 hypothetical protein DMB42_00815 [Nonomuraea sp. WAC 01424]
MDFDIEDLVGRYVAVWNEADPVLRRDAVADLWAQDGMELVESTLFRGHAELETRVTHAYKEFVEERKFAVTSANDVFGHHDGVTFTLQLTTADGEVAWAARVVLIVGEDELIRYDYHFTVQPLTA